MSDPIIDMPKDFSSSLCSVVIPTLGGESLINTIHKLNCGTVIPKEIIISVPDDSYIKSINIPDDNVKIVAAGCRGQVCQRVYGFEMAKYDYVLQIDDDVEVDLYCVEKLIETMNDNSNDCSVSPALICKEDNKSPYARKPESLINNLYYWLVSGGDGYIPGSVTSSGINIGIDAISPLLKDRRHTVHWLPGGCVLHKKKNLILQNYFPYSGKAYCEDLIHSFLLKKSGINLVVDIKAKSFFDCELATMQSFSQQLYSLSDDYKARKYYMKLIGSNILKMNIYYLVMLIKMLILYPTNALRDWSWR